ncbi:hypothetical protein [Nocardia sp. AG03]|uniref:hypothetical protein n=1 Tax=Nocardia sp. AG03 TaxID=3025312 RepID=UPI002418B996|nr:hypothetical protein [Nocardia sp. AG03]
MTVSPTPRRVLAVPGAALCTAALGGVATADPGAPGQTVTTCGAPDTAGARFHRAVPAQPGADGDFSRTIVIERGPGPESVPAQRLPGGEEGTLCLRLAPGDAPDGAPAVVLPAGAHADRRRRVIALG